MAKVRIQAGTQSSGAELPSPSSSSKKAKSDGAIELLTRVLREQGLSGWYKVRCTHHCFYWRSFKFGIMKGMSAQITKAVLCQALLFASKDQFELYTVALMRFLNRVQAE